MSKYLVRGITPMLGDNMIHPAWFTALLDDKTYHIEFNGHLTNHNKHAVIALAGLGASEETVKSYYENYAKLTPYGYGLEAPKLSQHKITLENWQSYLGKRTSYASYYQFFEEQVQLLGREAVLQHYLPLLLSGWAGALTHATIHLGWALSVNNHCMIMEGLAYMAFTFVSCHPERAVHSANVANESVLDSLFELSSVWSQPACALPAWVERQVEQATSVHPELLRSGLQQRVAALLETGHPLIYALPSWINNQAESDPWSQLHYAVTLIYLSQPGDFLLLHLLTSLHAMAEISNHLPSEQSMLVVKCFWIGMLCILFSRGYFPDPILLNSLNKKYKDEIDDKEMSKFSWDEIVARALGEEEEHNPKLVYVMKRMWQSSNYRSIYRIAASHFTTTPILPKSFESPPADAS